MTLREILDQIDSSRGGQAIYIERSFAWSAASRAVVAPSPQDGQLPQEVGDMAYVIEVVLAKEILQVWAGDEDGRRRRTRNAPPCGTTCSMKHTSR
jgi:hypothetical protein